MSGALILAVTVTTMSSRKCQRQDGRPQDPRVCTPDLHSTGGTEGKERERHIYSWENMSLFQVTNEIYFIVR